LIAIATSFYAAADSEKYDWTQWRHPERPDWHCAANSFGTWLVICLVIWPVFFPGYLWDRKYAPRKS